jgi:hypothetical protein
MFVWFYSQRRLSAAIRPPGWEYRHYHHQGHTCRTQTLEIREGRKVILLLPLAALEEVDETHALGEFFEAAGPWVRFHMWLYGQGYEPARRPNGVTGGQPTLTPAAARLLRGEGLKLQNRGLMDLDYVDQLTPGVRAWLARAMEHIVENRWRYDGQDLVEPRSPLARAIYADYEARKRCYLIEPDRPQVKHG